MKNKIILMMTASLFLATEETARKALFSATRLKDIPGQLSESSFIISYLKSAQTN
jgi:hypothetical protein